MQDPDTGDEFTGHEWVERFSGEFAQALQKDHECYLEYLAQLADHMICSLEMLILFPYGPSSTNN
jgi:hypothetical protein